MPAQSARCLLYLTSIQLNSHSDDGSARGDVLDKTTVEGPRGEVDVVLLCESGGWGEGFDAASLVR